MTPRGNKDSTAQLHKNKSIHRELHLCRGGRRSPEGVQRKTFFPFFSGYDSLCFINMCCLNAFLEVATQSHWSNVLGFGSSRITGTARWELLFLKAPNCLLTQLIALLNLSALGFSLVVFHDKAKRTQQGNLLSCQWPYPVGPCDISFDFTNACTNSPMIQIVLSKM